MTDDAIVRPYRRKELNGSFISNCGQSLQRGHTQNHWSGVNA